MKSLEAHIGEGSYDIRGMKTFKTHKVEITNKVIAKYDQIKIKNFYSSEDIIKTRKSHEVRVICATR